jgi:hypothetical protein
MTANHSLPVEILRALSKDLNGYWVSWITSLIPLVSEGIQKLLSCNRTVKAGDSWEWIGTGSWSNSVLFLKDDCWKWVIYGVTDPQTRERIQKLGLLMIYLVSHQTLESALYSACNYIEPVNKKGWLKNALVRNRASDPLPFPWESNNCIGIQEALVHFQNMILSTSLGSKFPPPFLLVKLSELEKEKQNHHLLVSFFLKRTPHNFFWMRSKPRMSMISLESKTGLKYITMDPDQYSTFVKHQCISCSFSVEFPQNDIACILPISVTFHYYKTDSDYSDFTLGSFIQHLYSEAESECSEVSCSHLFHQHTINYSHYKYNISISMTWDASYESIDDDIVYSWTTCNECESCTKTCKMSQTSLLYSFGKYLELIFYSTSFFPKLVCNHAGDTELQIRRKFRYKKLTISFSKQEIQLSQVRISQIQIQNQILTENIKKSVEALSDHVVNFYDNILIVIDQIHAKMEPSSSEKIRMMLEDMRILFLEEEKSLLEHLKEVTSKTLTDVQLLISKAIRRDKESFESWVQEFAPGVPLLSLSKEGSELPLATQVVELKTDSLVFRKDEPTSFISFTLLSEEFQSIFSKESASADGEWKIRNSKYESKVSYFSQNGSCDKHIKYCKIITLIIAFRKDQLSYSCIVYFAREFRGLQNDFGLLNSFAFSLQNCKPWKTQGGKSRVDFFITDDDKYVVKQLASKWTLTEKDELLKFAPSYFEYLKENREKPSILAKIFGFFTITQKNTVTGHVSKIDLIVMENIFANVPISKKFDLKGIPDRKFSKKEQLNDSIGLDHDWVDGHYKTLFKLHGHAKYIIQESVENDIQFLSRSNVMDYSLLVGIHKDTQELIIGIVDYIGPYNWYKKIEW